MTGDILLGYQTQLMEYQIWLAWVAIIWAIIIWIIQIQINNKLIRIEKLLYRRSDIENKLSSGILKLKKEIKENPETYWDLSQWVTWPKVVELISKYLDPIMEEKRNIESLLEKETKLK